MADLSKTQIDALIELNRAALSTALTSPKPNYSIGGRSVAYASYIESLTKTLTLLQEMSAGIPSESTVDFDYRIEDTGEDNTELEGDSNT